MQRNFNSLSKLAGSVMGLLLLAMAPANAGPFSTPVHDDRLDDVRGGFRASDGRLLVSFGVQRTVRIDDGATSVLASSLHTQTLLVQRGNNNVVAVPASDLVPGTTLIQNTLNGQKISSHTTIDISANSLQAYQGAHFQATLGTAITASLRR